MTAPSWHLDEDQIDDFTAAALAPADQSSAEAHLEACPTCRGAVASSAQAGALAARLERVWSETAESIDAPRGGRLERFATVVGLPDHLARVIGASAGFRAAWLASITVAVVAGLAMARGDLGPVPFLLLSPLVPVAGVATAFGGSSAAAGGRSVEIATPFGEPRLVLLRTAAVTATSILLLGATALASTATGLEAVAWLLPALALTTTTLALTTRFTPERAAGVVAVGWMLFVAVLATELPRASRPTADELGAIALPLQLTAVALLILSSAAFIVRKDRLDLPAR